ncbi:MAG: NAD-dependent protein deacylase [Clostridia bacterium]|nr:NAD-dependent protein deacylase [Clostridia bacterium]
MLYTTILFDADETLLDFRAAETAALHEVFRSRGLPTDGEFVDAYRSINNGLWERFNRGEIEKREITDTRFVRLFERFHVPLDGVAFNRFYLDELSRHGVALPGAEALCGSLRDAGCALYIITNGVGFVQKRRFRESGLAPYFAGTFISEEIGAGKPSAVFFDYVLRHIPQQDKRRILVVGDSLSADVAGGSAAGLDTCWYDRTRANTPNGATYTVHDFKQLQKLILGGFDMKDLQTLQTMIDESERIVIFSGAGVSTESGIPDFRGADGLYQKKEKQFDYPPETMLSHTFFKHHPEIFFDYYRTKMIYPDAKPNASHTAAAALERKGKLSAVVTQNIDGLYQQAGVRRVLELHGSTLHNTCTRCGKKSGLDAILSTDGVPRCVCGGIIKPDVVLYEESLDADVIEQAVEAIAGADCLIVAGTSLTVYPAAGFVRYFRGGRFVLINRDETPMDSQADLILRDNVGKVFESLKI